MRLLVAEGEGRLTKRRLLCDASFLSCGRLFLCLQVVAAAVLVDQQSLGATVTLCLSNVLLCTYDQTTGHLWRNREESAAKEKVDQMRDNQRERERETGRGKGG